MAPKEFSAAVIGGVATGIVLEEKGFNGIHGLFDYFWPGIGTIGVAAMAKIAKAEIFRQLPRVQQFCEAHPLGDGDAIDLPMCDAWVKSLQAACGPTFVLSGPCETKTEAVDAAFQDFMTPIHEARTKREHPQVPG